MKSPTSEARPDPTRVEELFHAASVLPTAERADFLRRSCRGDRVLEDTVSMLLAGARHAATDWERSALELEARHTALHLIPAQTGQFIGPYRIVRRIAAGGMSVVYEAMRDDAEFHKRVAIKLVQWGIQGEAELQRVRTERQILAQLDHPCIALLLDGGTTTDGNPYLVMEYVDGIPIDRFAAERDLTRSERLHLFLQVCEAVQYAHQNLVVHRDLKPANILVTPEGRPKLLDFGIAKLLTGAARETTISALTPEYASPEQVLGRSIGAGSDVYSLGVLLFTLLAERLPYRAGVGEPAALMRAICDEDLVWNPPGLMRGDLQSIVARALQKEPAHRYSSVEQFAGDIRRYLQGLPVRAHPDHFLYRVRKFALRRTLPLVASLALLAAVAGGIISTVRQSRRAQRHFDEVRSLAHSLLFEVYDSITPLQGSLAARRLLVTRAQQYLDTLAKDAGDDPVLVRELAESYTRLGNVLGARYTANLGDTAGALRNFRNAQVLLEHEAARHPGDTQVQLALSDAYLGVAGILIRQQNAAAAVEAVGRSIELMNGLCVRDPGNVAYELALSRSYVYLGQAQTVVAMRRNSIETFQQALASYQRAVAIQESVPNRDDAWFARLAPKYFYVGYALRDLGDHTGDAAYYRGALDISLKGDELYQILAAHSPQNSNHLRNVADGRADVGILRWKCCRDLEGAMRDLQESAKRFQALADRDPENVEARRDVADVYQKIGVVMAESRHVRQALAADHKALSLYEQLAQSDPTSQENAGYVAAVRARIATLTQKTAN